MDIVRKTIKPLAFAAVLLIVLLRVFHILSWKDTMGPYLSHVEQLYATQEDQIEVLFVGSSHCYGGINPDVLWQQHGIPSFNMACSGQDKISAVYQLREVLKTQHPKVVFVDVFAAVFDRGAVESNVYRNMISMKLSANSVGLVHEYFGSYEPDYILKWPDHAAGSAFGREPGTV